MLYVDGQLVGDADLRHIETDRAEFAIMIGARDTQGQGLGTLLSVLIHAFAFETLKLSAVYLTIVPHNEPGGAVTKGLATFATTDRLRAGTPKRTMTSRCGSRRTHFCTTSACADRDRDISQLIPLHTGFGFSKRSFAMTYRLWVR